MKIYETDKISTVTKERTKKTTIKDAYFYKVYFWHISNILDSNDITTIFCLNLDAKYQLDCQPHFLHK